MLDRRSTTFFGDCRGKLLSRSSRPGQSPDTLREPSRAAFSGSSFPRGGSRTPFRGLPPVNAGHDAPGGRPRTLVSWLLLLITPAYTLKVGGPK